MQEQAAVLGASRWAAGAATSERHASAATNELGRRVVILLDGDDIDRVLQGEQLLDELVASRRSQVLRNDDPYPVAEAKPSPMHLS